MSTLVIIRQAASQAAAEAHAGNTAAKAQPGNNATCQDPGGTAGLACLPEPRYAGR
jgi:hypothetical protein